MPVSIPERGMGGDVVSLLFVEEMKSETSDTPSIVGAALRKAYATYSTLVWTPRLSLLCVRNIQNVERACGVLIVVSSANRRIRPIVRSGVGRL